jgi:CheY-like chemotaxis protein/tetratricopeptide (TPR) repeat protein
VSKQVLIVEDDRALAGMIARAVEAEGYPVRIVHDGEAALEAVRSLAPGLVLLDLLLPRKDGRAVLRALRSEEETRELPVIVISGILRTPAHALEVEQEGAQGFLHKPLARSKLVQTLRELLGPPASKEAHEKGKDSLSLGSTPVAEVLWGAMKRGLTGAFHFQAGKKRKVLFLEKGQPKAIRSNVVRECLGQRMLSAGRISKHALEESLERARAGEGRQGELLVKMGAVSEEEVEDALKHQGEEKLYELFAWTEGSVHFEPDSTCPSLATEIENISSEEVILRGAGHMAPDALERALAPLRGRKVTLDLQSLPRGVQRAPEVEAVETSIAPTRGSADSLMRVHGPSLYALHLFGAVRTDKGGPAATEPPRREAAGSAPAAGSPPSAESPPAAKGPATLVELRKLLADHAKQSHFEVLDVKENAPTSEIKSAFFRLAKRFHPDRYGGEPDEVRMLAGEVFARISAAHETLTDHDRREEYLESLRSGGAEAEAREVSQIVAAEVQFRKGEALLKKKDYPRALELFRWAMEINPEEGEFRALYGWTAYLCNPNDEKARAEARRELERAVDLSPRSVSGYYYLGRLLKACGDTASAERMFRKAVEIAPDHVEASQELRVLRMRREKESEKKGAFGFGRKKG